MRTSPSDPAAPAGPRLHWPADPLGGDDRPEAPRSAADPADRDDRAEPADHAGRPEDLRTELLELRRAVDALSVAVQDELASLRQEVAALRRRLPLRATPAPDRAKGRRRAGPDEG